MNVVERAYSTIVFALIKIITSDLIVPALET